MRMLDELFIERDRVVTNEGVLVLRVAKALS